MIKKTALAYLSVFGLLAVSATAQSTITWSGLTAINDDSDISTEGLLFGSVAPFNSAAASGLTVNGVTFQEGSTLPDYTTSASTGSDGGFGSPNSGDITYDTLLESGAYTTGGNSLTITWDGMITGDTYQIQLWVNNPNGANSGFAGELIGGQTYFSTTAGPDAPTGGGAAYDIGTFTADSSGAETITLVPLNTSAQFNLLQIRDLTPTPEPGILALAGLGGLGGLLLIRRRKNNAA